MRRPWRTLVPLVTCIVLWGLITHASYAGTGDEPHYMLIAYSLVFDHDIDLTNNYNDPTNRALGGQFMAGAHARLGKDGRLRPVHDIGLPVLFAPYYAISYGVANFIVDHVPDAWMRRARLNFIVVLRDLLSLAMIGLTAVIGVQLYDTFAGMSMNDARSFGWALLLILSPPLLSFSFLFFTEILSALFAWQVFRWLRQPMHTRAGATVAGAITGYLFVIHSRNVGLVLGLVLLAFWRLLRVPAEKRLLVGYLSGVVALTLIRTAVIYHFWGSWITTPLANVNTTYSAADTVRQAATRLSGWLFDQEHGVLPYTPIYALVPVGWIALWRGNRELCMEMTAVVTSYVGLMLIPQLNTAGWRGGWSPAARFLVPIAPFLCVFIFSAVKDVARIPTLIMAIVAIQIVLDAVFWQHPGLLWNDGIGHSAFEHFLSPDDRLAGWLPSVMTPVTGRTCLLIGGFSAVWCALTVYLQLQLLRSRGVRHPQATV